MKRRTLGALVAMALTAAISACASTDTPSSTPSATSAAYPVTVGSVTLQAQPVKIVSLSPTVTETLFAIGAGQQMVAADEYSTYPADAPKTELSGYTPNAEAIAAYNPDLVILTTDSNNIVASLASLNIPVYQANAAANLDEVYQQITELGQLTGHADEATAVSQRMKDDIDKLIASLPARPTPLTYYYELDPSLYTVTSKTFIGSLFTSAGLTNIADSADPAGTGYPQLSEEALIKANPDLIFLADTKCCGQSLDTVKARAGWSSMTAVSKGQVVALDDDIASRWGPRVVDLVRAIVDAVSAIKS